MAQAFIVRKGGSSGEYSGPPEFTYTGQYEFIDDGDGNWRLKFLTSGTLVLLRPSELQIDVFLVGGGGGGGGGFTRAFCSGGGGGGGYTTTSKNITIEKDIEYQIVVGLGGSNGANYTGNTYQQSASANKGLDGGESSAFGYSASGGKGGIGSRCTRDSKFYPGAGGNGGSGGGAGNRTDSKRGGSGGSDGSNGANTSNGTLGTTSGGTGQGTTTREFSETSGDLYSGGGGGGGDRSGTAGNGGGATGGSQDVPATSAIANTGGGGGGAGVLGPISSSGASGIVIIRNMRPVSTAA